MLKAVIFDMDGVIIDSEPMHSRAAILAMEKFNVTITMDYLDQFIGSTISYMSRKIIDDYQINATPQEIINANNDAKEYLLKKEGYTVVPDIINFIKDLYHHGVKLMIASSSTPQEIEGVMDALHLRPYFNGYISGINVAHSKPAPDIFLAAAKSLGVEPWECIVIEDSYHGVTAACAAGILSIGFVNPNSGNQNLSKASLLVEGFEEVDYAFIKQFYEDRYPSRTIITSDLFIIREHSLSDLSELLELYQKPGVSEYLEDYTGNPDIEAEKLGAYIQNVYGYYGFGVWSVYLREKEPLIGRCGIELKILNNQEIYEISYLLDPDYQGLGYGRQFVKEVINYCFEDLGIPKITAVIDKNNHPSLQLAGKVGMRQVGECVRNHRTLEVFVIENPGTI